MKKDLGYYMRLPYTVELVPIPEEEGGGYKAQLPQVGRLAVTADGDTPEEALARLEEVKKDRFEDYLKQGVSIPEPEEESQDYSGRFVTRVPKVLHRQLTLAAKENQTSLNQYVNYLLTANLYLDQQKDQLTGWLRDMAVVWRTSYSFLKDQMEEKRSTEYGSRIMKQGKRKYLKGA